MQLLESRRKHLVESDDLKLLVVFMAEEDKPPIYVFETNATALQECKGRKLIWKTVLAQSEKSAK